MNSSRFATYGNGSLRGVWEDGERVLYRGSRPNGHGEQRAALIVLPAGERPSPASLDRLAHEYELKDELDGAWARTRSDHARARGPRRRTARSAARRAHGRGWLPAPGDRHRRRPRQGSPARPRAQGSEARPYPGELR